MPPRIKYLYNLWIIEIEHARPDFNYPDYYRANCDIHCLSNWTQEWGDAEAQ